VILIHPRAGPGYQLGRRRWTEVIGRHTRASTGQLASHTTLAEFVEHHITTKRTIPAVDDRGEAIRISSVVRFILDAAANHEDELPLVTDTP
jgi:hypothetical protein